jgi:hypothetical protein
VTVIAHTAALLLCSLDAQLRFAGIDYRGGAFGTRTVRTERWLPSRAGYVDCLRKDLPAASFPVSQP